MHSHDSNIYRIWSESEADNQLHINLRLAAGRFQVGLPSLVLRRADRTPGMTGRERQDLERPMIERALRRYLELPENAALPYDPQWLPNDQVELGGTPHSGLFVSLASDDQYSLCTVSESAQASHLARVGEIKRAEWPTLLGREHESLLARLHAEFGFEQGLAAAQILACARVAEAIDVPGSGKLDLLGHRAGSTLFLVGSTPARQAMVLSTRIDCGDGHDRVVALWVKPITPAAPSFSRGLAA